MKEILFQLDKTSSMGLQLQLKEQLASAILRGALQLGECLPSSRKLSGHLQVSRNTVTLVYNELVDSGYLESRSRSGFVVSREAPIAPLPDINKIASQFTDRQIDLAARIVRPKQKLYLMNKPLDWREFRFPFLYGQADFKLFSHSDWRDCARRALGGRDFDSLAGDFGHNDDPMLVNYITRHSLPQRGVIMNKENVLATLGAQNALYLIAELLINASTRVALEEPCYPDLYNIVKAKTDRITHIKVDEHGMVLDEHALSRCDVLFITPSHQCPTTVTMPVERRKKLLKLACRYDFLVVEDDYEFEMNFLEVASPALKSLDHQERVLYVGSFSKSLFPGLRLGYLVASRQFICRARELRHLILRHPPGHTQRTAAYFMALGYYNSQIARLKKAFSARREIMRRALESHGLHNSSAASFGGASFWIKGPSWLDADILEQELRKQSVLIESGVPFYSNRKGKCDYFRIAYSSIGKNLIPEGIERIRKTMDQLAP